MEKNNKEKKKKGDMKLGRGCVGNSEKLEK